MTRHIESDAPDRHLADPRDHPNGKPRLAEVAVGDAVPVQDDDGSYCPLSELKGDEPATAERLIKAPEFTGKSLRGFRDTDNPDFIDDYRRTYDAVGGPTAWASPRLNMTRMINQIQRHIYNKDGVDFTVVDLTGVSSAQADEVFENLEFTFIPDDKAVEVAGWLSGVIERMLAEDEIGSSEADRAHTQELISKLHSEIQARNHS